MLVLRVQDLYGAGHVADRLSGGNDHFPYTTFLTHPLTQPLVGFMIKRPRSVSSGQLAVAARPCVGQLQKNSSIQGQNLASTVLFVPNSLDSGRWTSAPQETANSFLYINPELSRNARAVVDEQRVI